MNTTPTTTKGEQARNQLIAAALAQFGEYGLHATTRDIAALAGQNIAAITYYFGSKEDLYLACAEWIADFIGTQFHPHVEEATALLGQPSPDREAIRQLILSACHNMIRVLTHDDTLNLSKFISREQLSPTAAYTGRDANDTETILHTHALLGEILAFRLGRETILLRTGWTQFDEDKAAQIGEVIACHLDLILQGLTQRSLKS